ncbi:hypothetical protein LA080_015149 [Diaporthe eres]|nr:hypothetical protein LA080_015149 [Diaporthe eres]
MPSSWYGEQPSTSQQPSAKRAETHEVMAEPAEPKPKPGTKEFALHKLNFHKQRMADAHEAKLAEAEKAANWQLKVDEWEDKGSTSKTIEDDLAKLVNEKKAAMKSDRKRSLLLPTSLRWDTTTVSTELRKSKPTNPKQKQDLQTRITHLVETTDTTTVSTELRDQRHPHVKAGIN